MRCLGAKSVPKLYLCFIMIQRLNKIIILIFALVVTACGSPTAKHSGASDNHGELTPVYTPRYADRFELLEAADGSTVLRIFNPWQGAEGVTLDYRLVPRATAGDSVVAGVIRVPVQRVVAMSSSYVAFMDALEAVSSVVGVSGRDFIYNENVRNSSVVDVGYGGNLNFESIVSLRPDALLAYEVGGENSASSNKLLQMGVPLMYVADYLESSPLGRAEWIVAFGALTGRLEEAVELFLVIEENYNRTAEMAAGVARHPKIMLNSPYRDVWYLPGDRSYMVRLLEDAGGDYLGAGHDSDISRPISSEAALVMLTKADLWLNPGMVTTLDGLRSENPRMSQLDVVRRGRVFNNNARLTTAGGSDFWESAAVRPDLVLADLVRIIHPELLPDHELYYFREL